LLSNRTAPLQKTVITWCTENPGKVALGIVAGGALFYWLLHKKSAPEIGETPTWDTYSLLRDNRAYRMGLKSIFQAYIDNPETTSIDAISSHYPAAFNDTTFATLYKKMASAKTGKCAIAKKIVSYLNSLEPVKR